jgi:heterodisulfide reductase subunit D
VVNLVYPKLSIKIAKDRVEEAKETGAEMLVTCCPLCYRQFDNRLWEREMDLQELIVLAADAIGIESTTTPSTA